MRRERRKAKSARGWLVDENMPADVSDLLMYRRFNCIHVGRARPEWFPQEIPWPEVSKATKDAMLSPLLRKYILLTRDIHSIKPGVLPKHHRGVVGFDAGHDSSSKVFALVRWFLDYFPDLTRAGGDAYLVGRYFRVWRTPDGRTHFGEVEHDGNLDEWFAAA